MDGVDRCESRVDMHETIKYIFFVNLIYVYNSFDVLYTGYPQSSIIIFQSRIWRALISIVSTTSHFRITFGYLLDECWHHSSTC